MFFLCLASCTLLVHVVDVIMCVVDWSSSQEWSSKWSITKQSLTPFIGQSVQHYGVLPFLSPTTTVTVAAADDAVRPTRPLPPVRPTDWTYPLPISRKASNYPSQSTSQLHKVSVLLASAATAAAVVDNSRHQLIHASRCGDRMEPGDVGRSRGSRQNKHAYSGRAAKLIGLTETTDYSTREQIWG